MTRKPVPPYHHWPTNIGSTYPWVCLERISSNPNNHTRSGGGASSRSKASAAGYDTPSGYDDIDGDVLKLIQAKKEKHGHRAFLQIEIGAAWLM